MRVSITFTQLRSNRESSRQKVLLSILREYLGVFSLQFPQNGCHEHWAAARSWC